jgi:WD40 repeat protein
MAFSPDGKTLATGEMNSPVNLWDVETHTLRRTLEGHSGYVWGVAFGPDGKTLVSGSEDETAIIWDVSTGKRMRTIR